MGPISKEVLSFVRACEVIHARLAYGDPLTTEERGLIELCGAELLSKVRPA